jgi:uncharacterized protein (TIGR00730 family)
MLKARLSEYGKFLKSLAVTTWRLLWGMWRLTRFPQPAITIFGGARIQQDTLFAGIARTLAKMLAAHGFSIITGGGPGIMQAANEGAIDCLRECSVDDKNCRYRMVSVGVGLIRLNKETANPYVQENIVMAHFFARKWLLVRYSVGFVIFPGGFGTFDELFEIVTLVQCNRMEKVPIVLINKAFWAPLERWIEEQILPHGLISQEDRHIMAIVDTAEEAFEIIQYHCSHKNESNTYDPEAKK